MTVTLTADQQAWIRVHVAKGEFASEEDAVRALIDESIVARAMDAADDDDLWAKPFINEGLAQIERGETIALEESRRRNQLHMQALKRQWRA